MMMMMMLILLNILALWCCFGRCNNVAFSHGEHCGPRFATGNSWLFRLLIVVELLTLRASTNQILRRFVSICGIINSIIWKRRCAARHNLGSGPEKCVTAQWLSWMCIFDNLKLTHDIITCSHWGRSIRRCARGSQVSFPSPGLPSFSCAAIFSNDTLHMINVCLINLIFSKSLVFSAACDFLAGPCLSQPPFFSQFYTWRRTFP